jgi:hypothetical protein
MSHHHRAFPAIFHLLGPTLDFPLAQSAVDKPAKISHPEFPSRANLPVGENAPPDFPAGPYLSGDPVLHSQKKKDLPFRMGRYFPPALFETLHPPERSPQNMRHLFLGFLQLQPKIEKFPRFHLALLGGKSEENENFS